MQRPAQTLKYGLQGKTVDLGGVEEESEKVGLKLNIQKTKIIPSSSQQIDGETVTDLIFLDSKITADGDCSHEIIRCLLFGSKAMTNLDSTVKSREHYFADKGPSSQSYGFSIVMYGCESWTIKKA